MNLTFYVVVIAFIFGLFYLCSRESGEDEDLPSTYDDGDLRTINSHSEAAHHHSHHQPHHHPPPPVSATLMRAPPDPGSQVVPQSVCPPSYEQVICNEDFYSLNKTAAAKNQQQQ